MRNVMRGGVMRGGVMLGGVMRSQRGGFDPLTLFSAGQQGAWYDTSDASVRYIERTGTSATTPAGVGDPLGTMLDTSPNANHVTAPSDAARLTVGDDGVVHAKPDGVDDVLIGPSLDGIGFPWTLACWINPADLSGSETLIATHDNGSTHNGLVLATVNGQIGVQFGDGLGLSSSSRRNYNTNDTVPVGQWSLLLAECRGYDDLSIYLNNVDKAFTISGGATTVSFAGGNIQLYFRSDAASPNKQSRTLIYRGVLSAADRTRLYELGP